MKEVVIISGKGGTGKTSIAGCFAALAKNKVLAAYCSAMAHRIMSLLDRISVEKDFAITGGIAKNVGVVTRLEKELGMTSLKSRFDTQIAGALGGALFAKALVEKQRKGA